MFKTSIRYIKISIITCLFLACSEHEEIKEVNFGYIGPLSTRATVLGIGPSKSIALVVEQYNKNRKEDEPKINFFFEDDMWEKDLALPKYNKLKREHDIDVLFISNTDGTVALQDILIKDKVVCINPINNDELLSSLNKNTFKVAKRTEVVNGLVGHRIIELGLKKTVIFHFPNDFMTRGAKSVESILNKEGILNKLIEVSKDKTDFKEELLDLKNEGYDSYCFFGYKNFGFAMKQARELGIEAKFFGSTTLLEQDFYDNSKGAIVGTEMPFFTTIDGNEVLADEFIDSYVQKYGNKPSAVWPALQSCDAGKMLINIVRNVNKSQPDDFPEYLKKELYNTTYFEGVCGNLSIGKDGASRGVYFTLYEYVSEMKVEKIE